MPSDFSRKTFDPKKHYSGVLKQQGRVDLDSDWNEQMDILQYRNQKETRDVAGASAVPKKGDSFKITPFANGKDLAIEPGHLYAGGLLCELEKESTVTYLHQPWYPGPDTSFFVRQQNKPGKFKDGSYLVYLDAWQREVTYLDDPLIREVALGEADTATRMQNVWQVKLLEVKPAGASCKVDQEEWKKIIVSPTGKLNARTEKGAGSQGPCTLPPGSGYRRLENQLYRVEIQKGGELGDATFKWSRDNATVETRIEAVNGAVITVMDTGKDEYLGFSNGQWVEIVSRESELNGTPQTLVQIISVDHALREITLSAPVSQPADSGLKLRRWDQSGMAASDNGVKAAPGWTSLEDGVQVSFSPGTYRAGDYWLIPARSATGEIEWPPFQIPNLAPQPQPPRENTHYYCRLACFTVNGGIVTSVEDCRPLFPALSELQASDVGIEPGGCELFEGVQNVQQALETLCRNREGACTFFVRPGKGWESVFDRMKEGEDARICFSGGAFPLEKSVVVKKKGNLLLSGIGPGTRIEAPGAETALAFEDCQSVKIADLSAVTGKAGSGKASGNQSLGGTLTFLNCPSVDVDHVWLKCGEGSVRAATCITVRNSDTAPGKVVVRNCTLKAGHLQQGVLLVNSGHALVENNHITVYAKSPRLASMDRYRKKVARAGMRSALISEIHPGDKKVAVSTYNIVLKSGDTELRFMTDSSLKKGWDKLMAENQPRVQGRRELLAHVMKLTDRLLVEEAFLKKYPQFEQFIKAVTLSERAAGAQGITIGGKNGGDLRILNNHVEGFLQGIHVGLSHSNTRMRDHLEHVMIAGNRISVVLPADTGNQERYGIFTGNCRSLVIENNLATLERLENAEKLPVDGICVWGELGGRVMISGNHLFSLDENKKRSFDNGIHVVPLLSRPSASQWVVTWNVAPSKQNTVLAPQSVTIPAHTNTP
jgi:hypothetical protein